MISRFKIYESEKRISLEDKTLLYEIIGKNLFFDSILGRVGQIRYDNFKETENKKETLKQYIQLFNLRLHNEEIPFHSLEFKLNYFLDISKKPLVKHLVLVTFPDEFCPQNKWIAERILQTIFRAYESFLK